MSRQNRRTDPVGKKMVDWQGLPTRPNKAKTRRFALHKVNQAVTKAARRMARAAGLSLDRTYHFHGGELTKAHAEREALRRANGWRT